ALRSRRAFALTTKAGMTPGPYASQLATTAVMTVAASAANAHAGPIVATWSHDHRPMHDRAARDDRAARPDASRVVNAGRAGGRVSLRNLNGEQSQDQQARSNVFHRAT